MSKKTRENFEFDFTRVYPVSNSQIPQIPKEKKVISNRRFFLQNQKNKKIIISKKFKKSKKKTQKYITKKIVELFGFFDFFEVF
jgi:hypothetical protein